VKQKKLFKILTVERVREHGNLTFSQLGTVRKFKGGGGSGFETVLV
jgi:hypothetical protein